MRLRVQLGGCIGGGETSCCHSERERSERKGVLSAAERERLCVPVVVGTGVELGRMALMYGAMASWISSGVVQVERFRGGYGISAYFLQERDGIESGGVAVCHGFVSYLQGL